MGISTRLMTASGHNRQSSERANLFRSAPESRPARIREYTFQVLMRRRVLPSDAHVPRAVLGIARSTDRLAVDAVEHLLDGLHVAFGGLIDEPARDQPQLVCLAVAGFARLAFQLAQDGLAHQPAGPAGFALLVGRGHDVSRRFEALVEGREIICRALRELRVIVVKSQATVAFLAEQPTHFAGHVAMIDTEQPLGLFLADCAGAVLQREPELVLRPRNPIAF